MIPSFNKWHLVAAMFFITLAPLAKSNSPSPAASPAPSPAASSPASPSPSPSQTPKVDRETSAKTDSADFQSTCVKDFHLPFSRKLIFSLDGTRAYIILPAIKSNEGDKKTNKGAAPERKLIVYEIQLGSGLALPQFGLRNTLAADLLATLDSAGFASSMAAVITDPAFSNCARGDLELVSGASNGSTSIRRKGFFGSIPSNRTPILFEPLNRNILQLDTSTMQSRNLGKVEPGNDVVYVDPLTSRQTHWDAKKRTLTTVSMPLAKTQQTIKVKEGFQILQTMGRFAALKVSASTNSILINEISSWTGVTKNSDFSFKLPATNNVTQALVWPNFDRKIALVQGRTDDVRRRWQKVFLVNYGEGRVIKEFSTKGVDYFGEVGISPNTKFIVLTHMDGAQSVADKIIIVDLSRNTSKEVTLGIP